MNEVSIIINGVRYDSVEPLEHELCTCAYCDILDFCLSSSHDVVCALLGVENKLFKESTKSFEP